MCVNAIVRRRTEGMPTGRRRHASRQTRRHRETRVSRCFHRFRVFEARRRVSKTFDERSLDETRASGMASLGSARGHACRGVASVRGARLGVRSSRTNRDCTLGNRARRSSASVGERRVARSRRAKGELEDLSFRNGRYVARAERARLSDASAPRSLRSSTASWTRERVAHLPRFPSSRRPAARQSSGRFLPLKRLSATQTAQGR